MKLVSKPLTIHQTYDVEMFGFECGLDMTSIRDQCRMIRGTNGSNRNQRVTISVESNEFLSAAATGSPKSSTDEFLELRAFYVIS